jgi:D-alanine-D-alanine ligase
MPGFTQYSMYPYLWQYTGINYGDLLEELMTLGQKQFDHRRNIEKNY